MSIRTLVAVATLVPALVLAALLMVLFALSTRRISEELGTTIVDRSTAEVGTQVGSFLSDAVHISDLYVRRVEAGTLPTSGLEAWERLELEDLGAHPGVASISFGNERGETTWALRRDDGIEIGRVAADGTALEHAADGMTGTIEREARRTYRYDPRTRPWYRAAVEAQEAGGAVWTPVYFWFGTTGSEAETGVGYTRAIRGEDGGVAGVLVIDVTLGGLSDFLTASSLAKSGRLFIIDEDDRLVAASHGEVNSAAGERLELAQSSEPAARAVATAGALGRTGSRVEVEGEASRVSVVALQPQTGVKWRLVTVLPESTFLGDAREVERRAAWVSAAAVGLGLVLAVLLGSRLARPLLALTTHIRRVGGGDFEARLRLRGAREFVEVSREMNRMAEGLEERVELQQSLQLAKEVQQSLLPQQAPSIEGMDVAGKSQYCDATGGDYFDYVPLADGRLLITVGDVMGHGIAAALLMATARAALRSHASRGGSLDELLARVNVLLSRDAKHGRFMTLSLVVIDLERGIMKWASAGHDPPIVYDPKNDRFIEVDGGGLPLGVLEEASFEEFSAVGIGPGCVIAIGTDGIWEAMNGEDVMFGKDRLREILRASAGRTSAEIIEQIEGAMTAFCGSSRHADDVTVVVAKVTETD